jgi:hypothetical protein
MLSRENALVTPRRRALAIRLCVLALAAGALGGLLERGKEVGPTRVAPQDQPGPVLLVPGYGGFTAGLEQLAAVLRSAGREATVIRLPGDGTGDLRNAAAELDAAADAAIEAGAPSVDVVGYSAGGITARYWVKELGGAEVARRIVTLGSPHHGTDLAALGLTFAPGACPMGCRQLAPASDLLDDLNDGDETPDGPQWMSLWTSQDDTVRPPESSRLDGAVEVVLQDVCPGIAVQHPQLPTTRLVQGLVLRALSAEPLERPTRQDCADLQRR